MLFDLEGISSQVAAVGNTNYHKNCYKYRLDDGSRSLRDLFHRGNRCIDVPSAKREGVYFGFQGEINPVETDELSSKVFIPHTTLLFKLLKATSH